MKLTNPLTYVSANEHQELLGRLARLEERCDLLEESLALREQEAAMFRAGLNANAIAMYGVLNAIGHNEWVRRCVSRRLDESYEGLQDARFSQAEYDAFDTMATNYRYCMTEAKEALEAAFKDDGE